MSLATATVRGMSVLHDYFRAPDEATAIEWAVGPGGDWHMGPSLDEHGVDWIDAKNLDPVVVLGQLVCFAQDATFEIASKPTLVWPDLDEWPYGLQRPGQESPWESGLTVERIPPSWMETLAKITDTRIAAIAGRWMETPEVYFADLAAASEIVAEFSRLASRARDRGHELFCRSVV